MICMYKKKQKNFKLKTEIFLFLEVPGGQEQRL